MDNLAYQRENENDYNFNKYRNLPNDAENEPRRETLISAKKNIDKTSALKIILLALVAAVLLFCVIYGKVQISDMYSQINNCKAELSTEKSENARLKAELESYTSLRNIEDYAEEIGLEKIDKAQIRYIDIQNSDVVEIPESEDNFFIRFKKFFNRIVERFSM